MGVITNLRVDVEALIAKLALREELALLGRVHVGAAFSSLAAVRKVLASGLLFFSIFRFRLDNLLLRRLLSDVVSVRAQVNDCLRLFRSLKILLGPLGKLLSLDLMSFLDPFEDVGLLLGSSLLLLLLVLPDQSLQVNVCMSRPLL